MKTILLICFLSITTLIFGKNDRQVIKEIDDINTSALILYNNTEIVKSFTEFIKAKALSDSIQDLYGSAFANYNLGRIYNLMENYESAKEHFYLSLKDSKKIQDNYLTASSYKSLAELYSTEKNYDKANLYFMSALEFISKQNFQVKSDVELHKSLEFEVRTNLCELYLDTNNFEAALINLLKVGDYIKTNPIDGMEESYYNYIYGVYYTRKELYNNANNKFKKSISLLEKDIENTDYMLLSKVYEQLSISMAKSGNNSGAFVSLLKHNSYKDKFLNETKVNQNLITKSKFLIEDYKNNAEKANSERLQQFEIAKKIKRVNIIVTTALILLFISLIIICVGYIATKKLSKKLQVRNRQLIQTKNQAIKASESKSKFISNVSHELRTPLYGVVGITSLLLENTSLSGSDKKHIKSLKYSGDYLLNLINDILQIGEIETNKIQLKNVTVNLNKLLKNIVNSFEYRLEETNNKISISIDSDIPDNIKCDNVRLSQIIINLVGNSIKFTTNGTIDLRVKLLKLEDEKVSLRFEIEDEGSGIPKDKFETIFDNFSQLEDSNINYQGTGLGLSITKNLIELFESKIELESELGVGTKFSFAIDFEIDKTQEKLFSEKRKNVKSLVNPDGEYKILVAEDNKINQIVTRNLLEKQNYKCHIVQNGKEALYEAKNNKYDLILMDINMPIMDGNEATEIIREFNKDIPIIALTAANIEEVKQNYLKIGYNEVISKPFDNYEFYQTIITHIQNSKRKNLELIQAS